MLFLFSVVLAHFIKSKLKQRKTGSVSAVPAYVVKKRYPIPYRHRLPSGIPTIYL